MEPATKHFRKRDAILTCLRQTNEHPSAEWVYTRLKAEYPDISLGTVYRNLSLFKEQGLINSLGTVKGVERFDGDTAPHVHFVCTSCGRVMDLTGMGLPECLNSEAVRCAGGRVDSWQLTFSGSCQECQKSNQS